MLVASSFDFIIKTVLSSVKLLTCNTTLETA